MHVLSDVGLKERQKMNEKYKNYLYTSVYGLIS